MKFYRVALGLICCLSGWGFAQEECDLGPTLRGLIGTRQGEGIGYKEGYSSANVFLTPNWTKPFQPFLDARGHIFNDGYYASNLGIGARFLTRWDWAFGTNLYYDFRSIEKLAPHQIGGGLEILSQKADVRFNGYFPVADTERKGPARVKRINGNQIEVKRHLTAAYSVINGELGFPIRGFFEPINLYMGLGPYYLFRKEIDEFNFGNGLGGEVRLNMRILDGVEIGGHFSYDRLFHGRINGYIRFSFPFGPGTLRYGQSRWRERYPTRACSDLAMQRRMMIQRVIRHEIIPMKNTTLKGIGVDPLTKKPVSMLFVNNAMMWAGHGTYNAPFNSLSLAEKHSRPGQVIYVMEGKPYRESITLKPGQTLHGSSQDLEIDDGLYKARSENMPVIYGDVRLEGDGTLCGVKIISKESIDASKSSKLIVRDVHFEETGLALNAAEKGVKIIEGNTFIKQATAISAQHLHQNEVFIRNNHIHSAQTGIQFGGPSLFQIHGNTFSNVQKALLGGLSEGHGFYEIDRNHIETHNSGIEFLSLTQNGLAQLSIKDNTIKTADQFNDAILIMAGNSAQSGKIEALVERNHLQGADGIFKVQHTGSHLLLRLESNWADAKYALINYEKEPKLLTVDAQNLDESGIESLNEQGNVLIPFQPVYFRPYEKGPRFFTPFKGFEEERE